MEKYIHPIVNTLLGQIKLTNISIDERLQLHQALVQLFVNMENGDSCLEITDSGLSQLLINSGIVGQICVNNAVPFQPLSLLSIENKHYLYLTRYYAYEQQIVAKVNELNNVIDFRPEQQTKLVELLGVLSSKCDEHDFPNIDQYNSIKDSLKRKFSIITGGPGTGKTTSVVLLLWSLFQIYGHDLKVKICAPTGKASKRVKESLQNNISGIEHTLNLDVTDIKSIVDNPNSFGTIHKLLGYIHQSIYFKANASNPLVADILIVDESSMIGLPLFYKLLSAINIQQIKHVIFLGDPNQLSSVEEGFVFSSLVSLAKNNFTSHLTISKRNQGEIGLFAQAILASDINVVQQLLKTGTQISLTQPILNKVLYSALSGGNNLSDFINYCHGINSFTNSQELFERYNQSAILCMTNVGLLGVINLNREIELKLKQKFAITTTWYNGRTIIILENERSLDLFNGDIGICLLIDGKPRIVFDDGRSFIPEVLPRYQLSYAITIHKSQGSEYQRVKIVIPNYKTATNLLSRELIYTAITRAKTAVELFCNEVSILNVQMTKRVSCLGMMINQD